MNMQLGNGAGNWLAHGAMVAICVSFLGVAAFAQTDNKSGQPMPAVDTPAPEKTTPAPQAAPREERPASHPPEAEAKPPRWRMFLASVTVFTLAVFVGLEIIAKVPPTLHTPLCSGSNAISGITVVGSIVVAGSTFALPDGSGASVLRIMAGLVGVVAVALAMTNVVGGFLVTHRMLGMFKARADR